MSTYVGFFCVDCRARERPDGSNHMHDQFAAVMKHRHALEEVGKIRLDSNLWWFSLDYGRMDLIANFFAEHIGHRVVVLSEYGGVYGHEGECNFRPMHGVDKAFDDEAFCRLAKGHDGDHKPGPRVVWTDAGCEFREPT